MQRLKGMNVKSRSGLLVVLLSLQILRCSGNENESLRVMLLPTEKGSALLCRGYVTNDEQELTSQIYDFTREFSHVDTLDGLPVYAFYSNNEKFFFHVDNEGAIEQLTTLNLTNRLIPYALMTVSPVVLGYWETMLKTNDGVGTEWEVEVDTTVAAVNSKGDTVLVRYYYLAKARFDGWGQTAIPESQSIQSVIDVHWYEIDNFIVNETGRDSLFVKRGSAHYYFDEDLGMIKYITDYKLKQMNQPYVSRHGTWELIEKKLPRES